MSKLGFFGVEFGLGHLILQLGLMLALELLKLLSWRVGFVEVGRMGQVFVMLRGLVLWLSRALEGLRGVRSV